jgi:hypothetical protein
LKDDVDVTITTSNNNTKNIKKIKGKKMELKEIIDVNVSDPLIISSNINDNNIDSNDKNSKKEIMSGGMLYIKGNG